MTDDPERNGTRVVRMASDTRDHCATETMAHYRLKANRKQANRAQFRLAAVLLGLNYKNVLSAGHLVYLKP